MNYKDVVLKLVGDIRPQGETHIDDIRFENLKEMCTLIEWLLIEVNHVSYNKKRHEYSMKRAGEYSEGFLKDMLTLLNEREN